MLFKCECDTAADMMRVLKQYGRMKTDTARIEMAKSIRALAGDLVEHAEAAPEKSSRAWAPPRMPPFPKREVVEEPQ